MGQVIDSPKPKRATAVVNTRRIVVCGSMSFYPEMLALQSQLQSREVSVLTPDSDNALHDAGSGVEAERIKRRLSWAHIRRVKSPKTFGLLVVNYDKHQIQNYIGPSTFAEIAIGAALSKRIFLLQGAPYVYEDVLESWGALCLMGNLTPLVDEFKRTCVKHTGQLTLFGD